MLNKRKVTIIIVLVIIIISTVIITSAKNCKSDDNCFNKATQKCSLAKVKTFNNDNLYNYKIIGKKSDNCIIEVTLVSLSESQTKDLREALNERSMTCSIPKELFQNKTIKDIDNLNDYCTGPLKEAILEITIDKMYELIVKDIGSLSTELVNITS